jgi:hypothetical protein
MYVIYRTKEYLQVRQATIFFVGVKRTAALTCGGK